MAGNGGAARRDGDGDGDGDGGGRTPGGGWVPVPDPTELTTEAVQRATDVFRREALSLRETLETRLDAADQDRARVWERLRDLPALYETFSSHLRDELIGRDDHDREILTQKISDMEDERIRAVDRTILQLEDRRREFAGDLESLRQLIGQRLDAMDKATGLLAGETARLTDLAEQGDLRTQGETRAMVTALRELIEQRLEAMDLATQVLAGSVEKFPSDIDRAVGNLREVLTGEIKRVQSVTEEKFTAIDGTFSSNALALTAALAAQKEAAAEQNKSNTLAITKSESSTKETIAANAVQAQTGLASLENQFDDIKERVVRIESAGVGASVHRTEARADRTEQRLSQSAIVSLIVALVVVAGFVISLITVLHKLGSAP